MNLNDCINIIKNCTMLACEYHIKDKCDYGYKVRENRFECAKEQAIKALEKQIPKKTDVKINDEDTRIGSIIFQRGTKVHYCPQCRMLVTGSDKYCRSCGQALIW